MNRQRPTEQMLDRAIDAARVAAIEGSCVLRFGTVTQVDTTNRKLTVQVGGIYIPNVPYMASYATPAYNDVVWLLHQGSILVAIGKP